MMEQGAKVLGLATVAYLVKILGTWCEVAMLDGLVGRVARAEVDLDPGARLLALLADDVWYNPAPEPVPSFKPGERVVVPSGSTPIECFGDDGYPRPILGELRGVVAASPTRLGGLELVVADDGRKLYISVEVLENETVFDVMRS